MALGSSPSCRYSVRVVILSAWSCAPITCNSMGRTLPVFLARSLTRASIRASWGSNFDCTAKLLITLVASAQVKSPRG